MKFKAKLARLEKRRKDWDMNGQKGKHQTHRPGSMKK